MYIYIHFYDGTRSIFELRISVLVSEQSHSSQDRFVNLIFHPVFLALLSLSPCLSFSLHILQREREREIVCSSSSILGSPPRPSIVPVGCFLRLSSSREHLSISRSPFSFSRFPGALSRHFSPSSLRLALSRTRSPDDSQTAGLYGVDLLNRLASGYTENKNALSNA